MLILAAKAFLFFKTWGREIGFDIGPHVEMVSLFVNGHFLPDIVKYFYGYHPPFSFAIAALFEQMFHGVGITITAVESIQFTSLAANLVMFFSLRSMLRQLKLLSSPLGIAFLGILAGLPINVFLSHAIAMDAVIMACAGLTFLFSMRLLWLPITPGHTWDRILPLGVILAAALFTKFSGLLLLAVPFLFAFASPLRGKFRTHMMHAVCAVVLGMVLVAPYYIFRYALPMGTLLPNNADITQPKEEAAARVVRDTDRLGFVLGMFTPSGAPTGNPQFRDMEHARLVETWRDVWRQDLWLGKEETLPWLLSAWYLRWMPFLCLASATLMLFAFRRLPQLWKNLGVVFLGIFVIEILALMQYTFNFPWGGAVLMKGIYVAPATFFLAYILMGPVVLFTLLPKSVARLGRVGVFFTLILVGTFVLLNHLLPVY